jgi:hypothetical protein
MKKLMTLATAMVLGSAAVGFAATDIERVTCAEFSKMDAAGKLKTSAEILDWLGQAANATFEPGLIAKYTTTSGTDKWTPDKLVIEIEGHCANAPAAIPVMERLEEHS